MLMARHGKLLFRKLDDSDLGSLTDFCNSCKSLGYTNNSSFESMKLSQMSFPYGEFFVGIDEETNTIFNVAGIHRVLEINEHAYRALFRGASLPGYGTGLTGLRASHQFIYLLNMQIDFILEHDPKAEFYLTTNHTQLQGKSSRMNDVWCPRAEKQGIISLIDDNFLYNHTPQRLWKIDVTYYKQWRVL